MPIRINIGEVDGPIQGTDCSQSTTRQDEAKAKDLYIRERDGKLKILAKDSAIIRRIPKSVGTVRIFADAEGYVLEEVRREARRFEESAT